jgi:hypothetical protein
MKGQSGTSRAPRGLPALTYCLREYFLGRRASLFYPPTDYLGIATPLDFLVRDPQDQALVFRMPAPAPFPQATGHDGPEDQSGRELHRRAEALIKADDFFLPAHVGALQAEADGSTPLFDNRRDFFSSIQNRDVLP